MVVINEPDNIRSLRITDDTFAEELNVTGKMFRELLEKGSHYGIHVFLAFTGMEGARSIMPLTLMRTHFRHRIALQMSTDDSIDFTDSSKASELRHLGDQAASALLLESQHNRQTIFQPFRFDIDQQAPDGSEPLIENMQLIFQRLQLRPHALPSQNIVHKMRRMLPPPASMTKPNQQTTYYK